MAEVIGNRRQVLIDQRDSLEAFRQAVELSLGAPDDADLRLSVTRFVTVKIGTDGENMRGSEIMLWIDNRLGEIERQLERLPFVGRAQIAERMNVLGKDLSQFKCPTD